MRTAVLLEPSEFELQDRPRPSPGPDDVLVNIRDVGICKLRRPLLRARPYRELRGRGPLVLGHESAGEVVEVGDNVDGFEPGDRVALEPASRAGAVRTASAVTTTSASR